MESFQVSTNLSEKLLAPSYEQLTEEYLTSRRRSHEKSSKSAIIKNYENLEMDPKLIYNGSENEEYFMKSIEKPERKDAFMKQNAKKKKQTKYKKLDKINKNIYRNNKIEIIIGNQFNTESNKKEQFFIPISDDEETTIIKESHKLHKNLEEIQELESECEETGIINDEPDANKQDDMYNELKLLRKENKIIAKKLKIQNNNVKNLQENQQKLEEYYKDLVDMLNSKLQKMENKFNDDLNKYMQEKEKESEFFKMFLKNCKNKLNEMELKLKEKDEQIKDLNNKISKKIKNNSKPKSESAKEKNTPKIVNKAPKEHYYYFTKGNCEYLKTNDSFSNLKKNEDKNVSSLYSKFKNKNSSIESFTFQHLKTTPSKMRNSDNCQLVQFKKKKYNFNKNVKTFSDLDLSNKSAKLCENISSSYRKKSNTISIDLINNASRLIFPTNLFNSTIIKSDQEAEFIIKHLESLYKKTIFFNKVYQATTDGDSARAFHNKCDELPCSLVVIETNKNKRFGGFTFCNWSGNNIDKKDNNAFLFSIDRKEIYEIIKGKYAIGCFPKFGPVFYGCQIRIFDDFLKNGGTTHLKNTVFKTTEDFVLSGERNYGVKELEVHEVLSL